MKVRITGEQRAVAVLKAFDRDNFKVIDKGLKEAGEVLRDEVRRKTPTSSPLSGWGKWTATRVSRKTGIATTRNLAWNTTKARTGIKVVTSQPKRETTGGKFRVAVATMSAPGAIFALTGSNKKRRSENYRGQSFANNLNNRAGRKYARGLNEAANNKPVVAKAKEKVAAVIREAERKADRILGRATLMAIDIVIQGDYKDRDIKRAHRDLDLLGKQSGTTGAAFTKMSGFAVGMGAAVGAAAIQAVAAGAQMAVTFGVDGVKAFLDDEVAATKLAKTMSNLGLDKATSQILTNIDALQRQTGVAEDLLIPAFDRLVRSVGNVDQANELLAISLDVAVGTGKSLDSVVQALGRAYDGSTTGLSRLGAGLDKATLATGDMDVITKQLADTFGGQAAVNAETFQGQIDRVSVAFGELQESFGRAFMEAVASSFSEGTDAGDALSQSINDLTPAIEDLGRELGNLVANTPKIVEFIKGLLNDFAVLRDQTLLVVAAFIAFKQVTKDRDIEGAQKTLADANAALARSMDARTEAYTNAFRSETGLKSATSGSVTAAIAAGNAQGSLASQISGTVGSAIAAGKAMGALAKVTDDDKRSVGGTAASAAAKTVVLTDRQKILALTMAGTQVAVKQATDDLAALTKASDDYAASITGAIQGTVDLSTAFSAAQKASQDGTLAAGESVVSTTIANFRAQILAAQQFAESLKNVAGAGGSQALIDQILQVAATQGPGAGEFLANTLVNDGVVPELTADLAAFNVFAGEAGTAMADNFYAQGITDAVQLLQGLSDEVAAQQKMLDRLGRNIGLPIAAAISEEIAKAIRDGIADGRAVAARRRASAFAAASFVPITVAPGTTGRDSTVERRRHGQHPGPRHRRTRNGRSAVHRG
jgi:hypothetical protein